MEPELGGSHGRKLLPGLLSLLSHTLQDRLPNDGIASGRHGVPTSIINQNNNPQTCLQATLMEVLSQLRFSHLGYA